MKSLVVSFCAVLFPTRFLVWDLGCMNVGRTFHFCRLVWRYVIPVANWALWHSANSRHNGSNWFHSYRRQYYRASLTTSSGDRFDLIFNISLQVLRMSLNVLSRLLLPDDAVSIKIISLDTHHWNNFASTLMELYGIYQASWYCPFREKDFLKILLKSDNKHMSFKTRYQSKVLEEFQTKLSS